MIANQWLGDQTHLAVDVGGCVLITVTPTVRSRPPRERVRLIACRAEAMHLFDADNGAALAHGVEPA